MFKKMCITYEDGSEKIVHGRKADVIRFERHFGIPASTMFEDGIWTERMWFFGWSAENRDNPEIASFDEWMETVERVEVVTEAEDGEADPPTEPDSSPTP